MRGARESTTGFWLAAAGWALCLVVWGGCAAQYVDPIRAAQADPKQVSFLFSDDFERGGLVASDLPAGKWAVLSPAPGGILHTASGAAHQGNLGLELVDAHAAPEGQDEGSVRARFEGLVSVYARYWVRLVATTSRAGGEIISGTQSTGPAGCGVVDVVVNAETGTLWVEGCDATGASTAEPHISQSLEDGWHLVETSVLGLGGIDGERSLYVDGLLRSDRKGLNLTGLGAVGFSLGEPWALPATYVGTLQFDDVRASVSPLASRVVFLTPATAQVGVCTLVNLSLRDSVLDAPSAMPWEISASLEVHAVNGTFFEDSGCSVPSSRVIFRAGFASAVRFVRFDGPGTAQLSATSSDFLGPQTTLSVLP